MYLKIVVAYSLLSISLAGFQTIRPIIDGQRTNFTLLEGNTAILDCFIEYLGKYRVGWVLNETRLLTVEEKVIADDTRFTIERPKTGQWNLHIKNITFNDRGLYICRVNTNPVISKYFNLSVAVSAKIRNEVSSNDTFLREGETLILICKATGFPQPEIEWSKGFGRYKTSVKGETMKIENVSRMNSGNYICVADNKYSTAYRGVKVTVVLAPEVTMAPREIGQTIGGNVFLDCKILAVPKPKTYWLKDNVTLETADNTKIQVFQYSGYNDKSLSTSSLFLSYLEQEHFGVYTCVAENSAGIDTESVLIYAVNTSVQTNDSDTTNNSSGTNYTVPEVVTWAKRIGQFLGGEVILQCEITGASREQMYWLKDNVTVEFFTDEFFNDYTMDYNTEDEIYRLKIENVRKNQFGEYKCCAENVFGKAFQTIILYEVQSDLFGKAVTSSDVTTSIEESGDAPKVSLQAKVIGQVKGRDVTLVCIIGASPDTNMYWMKDDEVLQSFDKNSYQEDIIQDGHVTKHSLRLLSIRDCDFGRYSCHAENPFGSDFDTALVYDYVKGLPVEEHYQKLLGVQESSFAVSASVPHTLCVMAVFMIMKSL